MFTPTKYLHLSQLNFQAYSKKQYKSHLYQCSFHVGSDGNSTVFKTCIEKSQTIFREAQRIGYNLSLLDIGGGFPGTSGSENILSTLSENIGQSLEEFLTAFPHTKVVSEPGENLDC